MVPRIAVVLLCISLVLYFYLTASAADSGQRSPGTVVNDNTAGVASWSNPSNATASDDQLTIVNADNSSQYLKATNFGFTIPTGATINGIVVSYERFVPDGHSAGEQVIRLVKQGNITGDNKSTGAQWSGEGVYTYGGENDLWGTTWTTTEINATDFGVVLQLGNGCPGFCFSGTVGVDYISMTVFYTLPAPAEGGGGMAPWLMLLRQQNNLNLQGQALSSSSISASSEESVSNSESSASSQSSSSISSIPSELATVSSEPSAGTGDISIPITVIEIPKRTIQENVCARLRRRLEHRFFAHFFRMSGTLRFLTNAACPISVSM